MATPNPALSALGFGPRDRVVVFHADDVGLCHATIPAAQELFGVGLLTSASIMVPCPWGRTAAAELAPLEADLGVHWTITSELERYRWRPLTGEPDGPLTDAEGYLPRTNEEIRRAPAEAVVAEAAAQLDRALAWGLRPSHVDAHMGAIAHPPFLPGALGAALDRGVWPMFPRLDAAGWAEQGLTPEDADAAARLVAQLEERGLPMVDQLRSLPLDAAGDHVAAAVAILTDLPPGLTHFYLHPVIDSPEARACLPDAAARIANFEALRSPRLLAEVERLGVQRISYAPLRDLMVAAR